VSRRRWKIEKGSGEKERILTTFEKKRRSTRSPSCMVHRPIAPGRTREWKQLKGVGAVNLTKKQLAAEDMRSDVYLKHPPWHRNRKKSRRAILDM